MKETNLSIHEIITVEKALEHTMGDNHFSTDSLLSILRKLNSAVEVRLVYNTLESVSPIGKELDIQL